MRKTFVATIAAATIGVVWADATSQGQFRDTPEAHAYLSYNFGGQQRRDSAQPFHYGLRLDHDPQLRAKATVALPPLLQIDRDNRGETLASAGGVPFAGINLRQNQSDSPGGTSSTSGGDSGWSFFDWTLLAVGIGGAGYLIYNATKGHDSPNAQPTGSSGGGSSSSGGGLLGGILPGGSSSSSSSGGGLLGGFAEVRTDDDTGRDFEHQHWLDGGTGQMGDIGGR